MRRGGNGRFRCILGTLNNPTVSEVDFWQKLVTNTQFREGLQVSYVVYQAERGANNGVFHYQIYVEFKRAIRLAGIKRRLGPRLHIEQRRGTQAQAIAYCTKKETRVEKGFAGVAGEAKKLGKDTLPTVMAALAQGEDLAEVISDYPCAMVKYGKSIVSYHISQKPKRNWVPDVHIFYGKTGTGKTAKAATENPGAYWIPKPQKGGWWWFNYLGELVVIWDEMRSDIPFNVCLRFLDRYGFVVQNKGGMMNMIAKKIIITTNIDPIKWYSGKTWEERAPLRRRLRDFCTIYDFEDDSTFEDNKWKIRDPVEVDAEEFDFSV